MTNFEYQRNVLLGLTSVLLVLLLILSSCLLLRSEKIIVLPPEVRREFWVKGNRFSPEYIQDMAYHYSHLALDANQDTFPYQMEILIRNSDTVTGQQLRGKFEKDYQKLKKNNAATRFKVKDMTVFLDQNKVHLQGTLDRYVGETPISSQEQTYEMTFKTRHGILLFKDLKRIDEGARHEED